MKKYCTKCGHEFEAVGREVICPACKAQATDDAKRAAVLKAKRASWTGESVPVRISGRASTVIRKYGDANNLPFAQALDALLRTSDYFASLDMAWIDVTPYKSRRRDRHTVETPQDETGKQAPQEVKTAQDKPQASKPQEVKQAAKVASTAKATKAKASKTSKTATSKSSKASKSVSTK